MGKRKVLAGLGMMAGMSAGPYSYSREPNTDMRSQMNYFNKCARKNKHGKK